MSAETVRPYVAIPVQQLSYINVFCPTSTLCISVLFVFVSARGGSKEGIEAAPIQKSAPCGPK